MALIEAQLFSGGETVDKKDGTVSKAQKIHAVVVQTVEAGSVRTSIEHGAEKGSQLQEILFQVDAKLGLSTALGDEPIVVFVPLELDKNVIKNPHLEEISEAEKLARDTLVPKPMAALCVSVRPAEATQGRVLSAVLLTEPDAKVIVKTLIKHPLNTLRLLQARVRGVTDFTKGPAIQIRDNTTLGGTLEKDRVIKW